MLEFTRFEAPLCACRVALCHSLPFRDSLLSNDAVRRVEKRRIDSTMTVTVCSSMVSCLDACCFVARIQLDVSEHHGRPDAARVSHETTESSRTLERRWWVGCGCVSSCIRFGIAASLSQCCCPVSRHSCSAASLHCRRYRSHRPLVQSRRVVVSPKSEGNSVPMRSWQASRARDSSRPLSRAAQGHTEHTPTHSPQATTNGNR